MRYVPILPASEADEALVEALVDAYVAEHQAALRMPRGEVTRRRGRIILAGRAFVGQPVLQCPVCMAEYAPTMSPCGCAKGTP